MDEEKISINLEDPEYDSLDNIIQELNLRGLKIKNKSEALRTAASCALENPEKLSSFIEKKLASKNDFSPEKDGFKSEAFVQTFIDLAKNKLEINLFIETPICRVYAGKDSIAETDRYNGGHVTLKGNPDKSQKRKKRAGNCRVSFGLGAIDKVYICDKETGEIQPYHYMPKDRFGLEKILKLDLDLGDD